MDKEELDLQKKRDALAFLEYVERNYYYNSSAWYNCETDKHTSRDEMYKAFNPPK